MIQIHVNSSRPEAAISVVAIAFGNKYHVPL